MGYVLVAGVLVLCGVGRWFFWESARQWGEFLREWDRGRRR